MSYSALSYGGATTNYLVRVASLSGSVPATVVASTDGGSTWSAPITGVGVPPSFTLAASITATFGSGTANVGDQFAMTVASGSASAAPIAGTSALGFPTTTTFTSGNGVGISWQQSSVNPTQVLAAPDTFTYMPPQISLNADLTAIDSVMATLSGQQAQVGAQQNAVQDNIGQLQSISLSTQTTLSHLADADIAALSTQMATAQTLYQAALAVDAKSIQPSLIDYLH